MSLSALHSYSKGVPHQGVQCIASRTLDLVHLKEGHRHWDGDANGRARVHVAAPSSKTAKDTVNSAHAHTPNSLNATPVRHMTLWHCQQHCTLRATHRSDLMRSTTGPYDFTAPSPRRPSVGRPHVNNCHAHDRRHGKQAHNWETEQAGVTLGC